MLSFEYLNSINPDFFRKGKLKSWQDLFDDTRHALFWILNYQAMTALGYMTDQHPICIAFQENASSEVEMPNNLGNLHYLDRLLTNCAQLIIDHTGKMPKASRRSNAVQLKDVYARMSSCLSQQGAVEKDSTWVHTWNDMLGELEKA